MSTLILKLDASGDVVRTTPILRVLKGPVTWITAERNLSLLNGIDQRLRVVSWKDRELARDVAYDLVVNLEDDAAVAQFAALVQCNRQHGAILCGDGTVEYTPDSSAWFDLSLISRFGPVQADQLKLSNRRSYQELLFEGLGYTFSGQRYFLPPPQRTTLAGDVAIASECGPVWPTKNWAYFSQLKDALTTRGFIANVLPKRPTLLAHLGDIANHRVLVSGDSLPMHLGLGLGLRVVSIFNCTSPWEIYDYGLLKKHVSPLLAEHFYTRQHKAEGTRAISLEVVLASVLEAL
jgi:heptosyltransferase-2